MNHIRVSDGLMVAEIPKIDNQLTVLEIQGQHYDRLVAILRDENTRFRTNHPKGGYTKEVWRQLWTDNLMLQLSNYLSSMHHPFRVQFSANQATHDIDVCIFDPLTQVLRIEVLRA